MDQQIYSLGQVDLANDAIDRKALGLLQLASLIWVLLALFATIEIIWLVLFPLIIILSIYAVAPKETFHAGPDDWDKLCESYINQNSEACFNQVLSDYVEVIGKLLEINERKSRIVQISAVLFCVQVIGVMIIM